MRSEEKRKFQHVFHMIAGINESLTKHLSCECNCKFDGRKCNSNQRWNNSKWQSLKTSCVQERLYLESCYV